MIPVSLFLVCGTLVASSATVPPKLQAALYRKIFNYDSVLKGKVHNLKILVIGEGRTVVSAFKARGFDASMSSVEQAHNAAQIQTYDVVYFMSDVSPRAFAHTLKNHKILSISGTAEHARNGSTSISIVINAQKKPSIIINLKRSIAEGHDFSSQLLSLAEVIK